MFRPISILLLSTLSSPAVCDEVSPQRPTTAVSFHLSGGSNDFSNGIGVATPWFAGNSIAVQAAVMQSWFTHGVDDDGEETWIAYQSAKLGLMGGSITSNGFMRMYGAGGILLIKPSDELSDDSTVSGGYGAFGFEFLSGRSLNYYIELGANGVGAVADKQPGKPIYANGFSSTVGFRYYL